LRSFVSSFFDYFILTNGSDKIVIILLLLVEICVEQQTPQNKTLKVTNKTCKTIEPADKKKEEAPP
jgi:hypothetical protein